MKEVKTKLFGKGRVTVIAGAALIMAGAGFSAHASPSTAETAITVTVDRPVIESATDRENAIKDFRRVAQRVCHTSGRRGLSAIRSDAECVDSLVSDYIYKIDKNCGGMKFAAKIEGRSET